MQMNSDLSINYSERTNPNLLQIYVERLLQEGNDCECINCDVMNVWIVHLTNEPTHRMCNWCSQCMDCEGVVSDLCDCDEREGINEANNNPPLCGDCNQ